MRCDLMRCYIRKQKGRLCCSLCAEGFSNPRGLSEEGGREPPAAQRRVRDIEKPGEFDGSPLEAASGRFLQP
jgi:hypothetical protein